MKNRTRSGDYKQNLSGKYPHMKIVDMNYGETYLIQHCDNDFSVSKKKYEATCPICGHDIRIASLVRDWEENGQICKTKTPRKRTPTR